MDDVGIFGCRRFEAVGASFVDVILDAVLTDLIIDGINLNL